MTQPSLSKYMDKDIGKDPELILLKPLCGKVLKLGEEILLENWGPEYVCKCVEEGCPDYSKRISEDLDIPEGNRLFHGVSCVNGPFGSGNHTDGSNDPKRYLSHSLSLEWLLRVHQQRPRPRG